MCSSIAAGFAGLITHELAHKLSKLADEYDCYVCDGSDDNRTYTGSDPAEVNITSNANRASTKWADLIATTTAIPTTNDVPPGVVGLWAGGGYYRSAIYRPQSNCHMRTTGSEFCTVCARKVHGDLQIRCTSVFDLLKYRRFIWREKFHLPIPICLSCPLPGEDNLLDQVAIRFAGLPQDARVQIIDSNGRTVAEGRPGRNGIFAEFTASRSELYSAEVIPGASASNQQVTVEAELTRNGQIQELPELRRR